VNIVKIDDAFVQNIVKSGDDRAFVHTLIDLSRRLGLKTLRNGCRTSKPRLCYRTGVAISCKAR
jgi:EAL domain-containing protein (putative c-di-GMP-specific phosphodiesterase class I)